MRSHKLSGTYELNDLRFICKMMAAKLSLHKPLHYGRFPIRKLTEKVQEGTVTCYELEQWLPVASKKLNRPAYVVAVK